MSHLKVTGNKTGYTLVSNVFIDQYMVTAGSSHLKTYLLLLRLFSDPHEEISIGKMADILDCSESDVLRSLRHWQKKGLMQLEYEADGKELSGIHLLEPRQTKAESEPDEPVSDLSGHLPVSFDSVSGKSEPLPAPKEDFGEIESAPALPSRSGSLSRVACDENFSRLTFIAEQYIGAPLSGNDCEIFAWLYDGLKMDVSLLEYLVESCVNNGHRNVRYMEKVAVDWHQKKITTVEQARIYTPLNSKNLYAVMKALGLSGRQPAPSERQIIDSWFQKYAFPLDMIVEACNRTMVSIHEANLNYVESILSRWKKAGISSMEEVKALDESFQKEKADRTESFGGTDPTKKGEKSFEKKGSPGGGKKGSSQTRRPTGSRPGAQFHDFDQREYDYDALLKQINALK